MFKKWLLKLLLSLSAEQKEQVRKSLFENVDGSATEYGDEKENEEMEDEKKTVKTEEETKTETETPKKDEGTEEKTETKTETAETTEEKPETEEQEAPVVQETPATGNAIRLEDLVTVDQLREALASTEAKFDAVLQENKALKEKYEEKDFGAPAQNGVGTGSSKKEAAESFDSYAKQFM